MANVPPRSSAASAGGTSEPTGAKRMAESSGSGGLASAPAALAAPEHERELLRLLRRASSRGRARHAPSATCAVMCAEPPNP